VPSVDRKLDAADDLGRLGPGLAELAGDPPDAQHGLVRGHLHHRGQQVDQRGLPGDVAGGALGRVLGAVAGLHHVQFTGRDPGQQGTQRLDILGVHERRFGRQLGQHFSQIRVFVPFRLLASGFRSYLLNMMIHRFTLEGSGNLGTN
jgi:hypothetical protein